MTTPLLIGGLTFLAIFGGALCGVCLAGRLPGPHLNGESRTVISVSMAVVGTMSALVLSLLISNSSVSFNAQVAAVESLAVDMVRLDRALARLADGTTALRGTLLAYGTLKAQELSGQESRPELGAEALKLLERLSEGILALHLSGTRDSYLQQRALALVEAMTDARWTLAETAGSAIPRTFLVMLILWLSLLFASFGLFAPKNETVLAALLLCALAISGGIFIILELGSPNSGLIRVSVVPIETAIQQIRMSGGQSP